MAARQSERRGGKNNNKHVHKSAVWAADNTEQHSGPFDNISDFLVSSGSVSTLSSNPFLPRAEVTSCSSRCCQATLFSGTFYEETARPAASSKTAAFLWKTQMEAADNGRWAIQRRRRDEGGRSAATMEPPLTPDKRRGIACVCVCRRRRTCECIDG